MRRIGILHAGRLGAALGQAIVRSGGTTITCVDGRSEATRDRAVAAGCLIVPSLEEVVARSDIVLSLVTPASAIETARNVAISAERLYNLDRRIMLPIFMDCNSIAPRTKQEVVRSLSSAGICGLDGTFLGPANEVGPENVLAVSGPGACKIVPLFERVVEVKVVGEQIGQASALKMALAIMTKALCALFLEMAWAAKSCGRLSDTLELMRRLYPGTMDFVERSLPNYPATLVRRIHELKEAANWQDELGCEAVMTRGAIEVFERLRRTDPVYSEHTLDEALEQLVK